MKRSLAILQATGIVALIGAVGGALGGMLVGAGLLATPLVVQAPNAPQLGEILAIAGVSMGYGAGYGVVLGPLLGWALMRRVPLGRAIGETAFAAALGVGVSFVAPFGGVLAVLGYPVLAATAAALRLRYAYRHAAIGGGTSPAVRS